MNEVPCMDPERIREGALKDELLTSCPQTSFGLLGNLHCYKPGWERARQAGRAEVDSSAEVGNAGDQRRPIDGSPISGCRLTNCLPSPCPIDQQTAAAYYVYCVLAAAAT